MPCSDSSSFLNPSARVHLFSACPRSILTFSGVTHNFLACGLPSICQIRAPAAPRRVEVRFSLGYSLTSLIGITVPIEYAPP